MYAIIRIDMDNAAFDSYPGDELAQILRKLANRVEAGVLPGDSLSVQDTNGNQVGRCEIIEDAEG